MKRIQIGTDRYTYPNVPKAKKVQIGTTPFRGVPFVPMPESLSAFDLSIDPLTHWHKGLGAKRTHPPPHITHISTRPKNRTQTSPQKEPLQMTKPKQQPFRKHSPEADLIQSGCEIRLNESGTYTIRRGLHLREVRDLKNISGDDLHALGIIHRTPSNKAMRA